MVEEASRASAGRLVRTRSLGEFRLSMLSYVSTVSRPQAACLTNKTSVAPPIKDTAPSRNHVSPWKIPTVCSTVFIFHSSVFNRESVSLRRRSTSLLKSSKFLAISLCCRSRSSVSGPCGPGGLGHCLVKSSLLLRNVLDLLGRGLSVPARRLTLGQQLRAPCWQIPSHLSLG